MSLVRCFIVSILCYGCSSGSAAPTAVFHLSPRTASLVSSQTVERLLQLLFSTRSSRLVAPDFHVLSADLRKSVAMARSISIAIRATWISVCWSIPVRSRFTFAHKPPLLRIAVPAAGRTMIHTAPSVNPHCDFLVAPFSLHHRNWASGGAPARGHDDRLSVSNAYHKNGGEDEFGQSLHRISFG